MGRQYFLEMNVSPDENNRLMDEPYMKKVADELSGLSAEFGDWVAVSFLSTFYFRYAAWR